ncbi:MAG TPA: hypothetical protein VL180_07050 [Burkholderiales bacterium]|nr:hypothetical protein [Burkholderiales bacterium]
MSKRRLVYRAGNEHNPGNPFGRAELVIEADGRMRLEHFARRREPRAWTGTIDAAALERLDAALERANFPVVAMPPLRGGAEYRQLAATGADGTREAIAVEWHAVAQMPGYREAFSILDATISQLGIPWDQPLDPQSMLVHDVQPAEPRAPPPPVVRPR